MNSISVSTSFTTDRRTSSGSAFQRGGGVFASRSSCSRTASSSCTSTVAIERVGGLRGDGLVRRDAFCFFMNGSEQLRCEREDRPGASDGDGMPRKQGLQSPGPLPVRIDTLERNEMKHGEQPASLTRGDSLSLHIR